MIKLTGVHDLPVYLIPEDISTIEGYPHYTKIFFKDYKSFIWVKEKPELVYALIKNKVYA